ncbi:hypothetical protein ACF087_34430 [Streptomyces goshikiensis]|uniref:hypothetical protein n=1 Tax=Streptomyces goshikiensis TaxID=1942 RepID=UPI003702D7E9
MVAATALALAGLAFTAPAHADDPADVVNGAAKGTFSAAQEPSGLLENVSQDGGLIKTVTKLGD